MPMVKSMRTGKLGGSEGSKEDLREKKRKEALGLEVRK